MICAKTAGCVREAGHSGACTFLADLPMLDLPPAKPFPPPPVIPDAPPIPPPAPTPDPPPTLPTTPAPGITKVTVVPSDPPPVPHTRATDDPHRRFEDMSWREQAEVIMRFNLAPWVEHWRGWSLTRIIAAGIFLATVDISHDWIEKCVEKQAPLGWAFTAFALLGFFLAVVTALGAKYIDKVLTIIAGKLGIELQNAPVPGLATRSAPRPAATTTATTRPQEDLG